MTKINAIELCWKLNHTIIEKVKSTSAGFPVVTKLNLNWDVASKVFQFARFGEDTPNVHLPRLIQATPFKYSIPEISQAPNSSIMYPWNIPQCAWSSLIQI